MADFHIKDLARPDEVIEFPLLTVRLVDLGDITVGHFVNEPGWSWYEHVRPRVGGEWCEARHHREPTVARLLRGLDLRLKLVRLSQSLSRTSPSSIEILGFMRVCAETAAGLQTGAVM